MGSEFDAMAGSFSAPMLRQQFAERDDAGELGGALAVFEFKDRESFGAPVILGPEELSNELNSKGNWVEAFRRPVVIQRSDLPEDITDPPMRATVVVDGNRYRLADEGHRVDGVSMTLRLSRKPLVQEKPEFGS